jgi:hypothetical protein
MTNSNVHVASQGTRYSSQSAQKSNLVATAEILTLFLPLTDFLEYCMRFTSSPEYIPLQKGPIISWKHDIYEEMSVWYC